MGDTQNTDIPEAIEWSPAWSIDEKLDFVAFHVKMMGLQLDRQERMLDRIGQLVTNTDAFTVETRAAIEGMRKNPLMRGMMPNLTGPPGIIRPAGAQG
jgi:hypothetical protein